jgi:transcriptional regulator with XRE-family HTH domain
MTSRPTTLSEYVRLARERAGLSQRQLAVKAGVNYTRIARIENGDTGNRPTPEHLQKLADALGEHADISEMLEYLGVKPPAPRAYFRRAYGLNNAEAEEAEQRIAEIIKEPYSKPHLIEKKNNARAASNASRYVL